MYSVLRRTTAAAVTVGAAALLIATSAGARPLFQAVNHTFVQEPTTAQCVAATDFACYDAAQIRRAYGADWLGAHGLTGRGYTIVLVDSFGSPTIQSDLQTYDEENNLPDPPSFKIITPAGPIPSWSDVVASGNVGWGEETTLDVEASHTIAPGANILLVETPVAETEGVTGFPQMIYAENWVIRHNLGDVISQSFGATEQTFQDANGNFDPGLIYGLRSAYYNAAAHGVTVLASAGDTGVANYELNGSDLYPFPTVGWPASDPLVTAMGGTQLHLDDYGNRTAPDNVWNDEALFNELFGGENAVAGSGGVSAVFPRPSYQDRVANVVGDARGMPDLAMSAAVNGGILVYWSFPPFTPGWQIIGGTSEASPLMAGEVAIADQIAHHRLGQLNPALYQIGDGPWSGITDITSGNNGVTFTNSNGVTYTLPGYTAGPGYDLASGLGSPNVRLPFELAALAGHNAF